jgi:phosphoribosylformylglycinamidine (FGAM) synthase-like enzyme
VPRPDLTVAPSLFRALHSALSRGLVLACHDLSEGGLAVAAAEMAFAGSLGLDLRLAAVPERPRVAQHSGFEKGFDPDATRLYSESCSRFLCEVAEGSATEFERAIGAFPSTHVGDVSGSGRLRVTGSAGKLLFDVDIEDLRRAHRGGFQG